MDGYIVRKKSIDCYLSYLQSSDSRTIIMALQELFFDVEKGKLFAYYERRKIEEELIRIITTDTDARVRQWCYMLGSFLKSPKLVSICKKKFEQEVPKNKTWILALLSHNLDTKEFLIIRKQAENFLSKDTINLSTYLFSNYQYEHLDSSYVRNVMKQDDNLAMLWFGWIATCRNQNLRYQKQELLTHEQMSEITQYDGDCGKLLDEIAVLTNHLRSESGIDSDERDILIGKLAEAKREANKNDYSGAVEIIKKIGKELYIIARTIGCSLIASLIKNQTGIIP